MSSEVVMLSNQSPIGEQSYFTGQQGYNITAPDERQVLPSEVHVQEQNPLKPAAQTAKDASYTAVGEGKTMVKSGSNNSIVSLASNLDTVSKHHQTAEELKQAEDDNKAEKDDGPMSPFFV